METCKDKTWESKAKERVDIDIVLMNGHIDFIKDIVNKTILECYKFGLNNLIIQDKETIFNNVFNNNISTCNIDLSVLDKEEYISEKSSDEIDKMLLFK